MSEEFNVTTRYIDSEGKQAAIGFEQEVDAIRVAVNLPDQEELAGGWLLPRTICRRGETPTSGTLVLEDPELSTVANWFQRDRLYRVALLALTRAAIAGQADISAILDNLTTSSFADILYQAASQTLPDDLGDVGPILEEAPAELEEDIRGSSVDQVWEELLSANDTQQRILALAREMSHPDPDRWGRWLRERIHETLGQALLAAAHSAAPEHMAEGSLLLDLDRGDPRCDVGDSVEIWLTESAIGGSGAVEALAHKASDTPRMLIDTLEAAISPGRSGIEQRWPGRPSRSICRGTGHCGSRRECPKPDGPRRAGRCPARTIRESCQAGSVRRNGPQGRDEPSHSPGRYQLGKRRPGPGHGAAWRNWEQRLQVGDRPAHLLLHRLFASGLCRQGTATGGPRKPVRPRRK